MSNVRLLYIEDDAGLFMLLRAELEGKNYEISHAHDGEEGLQIIQTSSFDVVLVDQHMPKISGLEVIQQLQLMDNPPPIIMVTGAGNEETAVEAMRMGASDYLVKDTGMGYLKILPSVINQVIQQRELAKAHRSAQQALTKERLRSELASHFIRDASHEFRTPLTIIESGAHLLFRMCDQPKQQKYIQQIVQQSRNILYLVDDLNLLARLDSTHMIDRTSIQLSRLIHDLVAEKADLFAQLDIAFKFTTGEKPLYIQGCREDLSIAISRILDNARKYTQSGGQVIIELIQENATAFVRISDTGIGIDSQKLPHIFERFYRGDEAHTTRGFGLGLPIVARIIDLHDGDISVESKSGEGTTFTVSLPIHSIPNEAI